MFRKTERWSGGARTWIFRPPSLYSVVKMEVRGTRDLPFKIAIVGGGPAGTAIIVRAIRLGVIDELLGQDPADVSSAGLLLCEAGPASKLGSGELGNYAVNSNTYASKFVGHVVNDRLDVIPPERASGTVLEPLRNTPAASVLEGMGAQVAPLSQIGAFLEEVGKAVRSVLTDHPESACLCDTKVRGAEQMGSSGLFRLALTQTGGGPFAIREVYASKLILATGGCQRLPVRDRFSAPHNKVILRYTIISLPDPFSPPAMPLL